MIRTQKNIFSSFFLIHLLVFLAIFSSCENRAKDEKKVANGGKVYGGVLRTAENDPIQSILPISLTDHASAFVATQVFDGLLKFNESSLKVEPCLAEKWESQQNGKKYRFYLKKNCFFQNDICFKNSEGRQINANDVKFSFELLCKNLPENQNFSSTFKNRVLGADDYHLGKSQEVKGFKVIDDFTFEIELINPSSLFLQLLCQPSCSIIAKEAFQLYGASLRIGSGAFYFDSAHSTERKICLSKNQNYHGKDKLGNSLPFLDSVLIYILESKEDELKLFQKDSLDMITSLPSSSVKEIVINQIKDFKGKNPKYRLDNNPEMITQYYSFNTTKPPFNDVKIRQAFNYAINRQKIVEEVLAGQAFGAGIYGITPPAFSGDGFSTEKILGYDFNPDLAKKLLAEAGYPNGQKFPVTKIVLNSGGAINTEVVIEIQKQLKEILNIELDFYVVPSAQKLEDSKYGKADIIREAWVADYPSPESFLGLFYGKTVPESLSLPSFPNTSRFKNDAFDNEYELGRDAAVKDSSIAHFMKADQVLMNQCPLIVLWYEGSYKITNNRVKDSYSNPMRYRNFSETYIAQ